MSEACRACPARLVDEAGRLVGLSLSDLVPPQAQVHLFNAQRELLLALAVTLEHNTSGRAGPGAGARARARSRRAPSRVELD